MLKHNPKFLLVLSAFLFFTVWAVKINYPRLIRSANLTAASVTLGNSRLSYSAGVTTGAINTSSIVIDTSGNSDNDTHHLFPKDTVCFASSTLNGCQGNANYTVTSVKDTDEFNISSTLPGALNASDLVIATQSGSMTIAFTTATIIPVGGDILVTIPMTDSADGNDGFPEAGASTSVSGFDLNGIAAADISVTGCTDGNWNATETIAVGSGTTDHTIRIDRDTTTCAAGTAVVITIDSSPGIVNPPPITTGHTQGLADSYTINVKTRDTVDATLDEVDMKVAPIEAVLVSATVDETLSFRICGVKTDLSTQETACFTTPGTVCGMATLDKATYAYAVPFLTVTNADGLIDAAQYLKVSTNADGGYTVKVSENDQLGKSGNACLNSGAEDETVSCIKDTACDGNTCTHVTTGSPTMDDWETATTYGFGYSLDSVTGDPATWEYDGTSGTCDGAGTDFCAAQFADEENSQDAQQVMISADPVNGDDAFVCYRLSISPTQPAGYYQNRVRYIATAIF